MTTALITHPDCLYHETPFGHPECADRLRFVLRALEGEAFQDLIRVEAPRVSAAAIDRAHVPGYTKRITDHLPDHGFDQIDGDTFISPGTWEAAQRAAGAVVEGVDLVMRGEVNNAFCAIRPPGHHAEAARPMGFCFLANAAIGALHAIAEHGLSRVAIVDFDVHHGNGTQDIVERDGQVFYGSTHEWPLYPHTGAVHERGVGNIANVCLPAGTGSVEFREAFEIGIIARLETFKPELVIISAGFDAHDGDPLANLRLTDRDFAWMTRELCQLAHRFASGRVVSTLEGGYDLRSLASSSAIHVRTLMEQAVAKAGMAV
ncbi:MAG: histone deacetylase family protein [Neomegalonema sp.]|nr:histone deacetylase family protein [Neomegalonema sp.]